MLLLVDNTPGLWAWMAPGFDYVFPKRYMSSHARDITNGMVTRAIMALDAHGPALQEIEGDAIREFLVDMD